MERKSTVRPIPVKGASVRALRLPGPALSSFTKCHVCAGRSDLDLLRHQCDKSPSTNADDYGLFVAHADFAGGRIGARSCSIPASAQNAPPIQGTTTTTPGLTLAGTVSGMVKPVAAPHVGDALNFDTILEVGTMPLRRLRRAASPSSWTQAPDFRFARPRRSDHRSPSGR